ncbi:hypothetical protein [Proteus mirabilis]|uniref:hypothetical protein n=1 Tax=Proteus mirabilis TaxID=584 RepID=UPI0034D41797
MANKKDSNGTDLSFSDSDRIRLSKRFNNSEEKILRKQNKLDKEDIDLNRKVQSTVNETDILINSLSRIRTGSGLSNKNDDPSSSDVMISLLSGEERVKSLSRTLGKKELKTIEELKKAVVEANGQHLRDLIATNKESYYSNLTVYNMIMKIIPKMRMVMRTITNNIISPDDFTKSSLNIDIDDSELAPEQHDTVRKRINDILENFKINEELADNIITYLRDGKSHYLCLSMNKELQRLLSEDNVDAESLPDELTEDYKQLENSSRTTILTEEHKSRILSESEKDFKVESILSEISEEEKEIVQGLMESFSIPNNVDFNVVDNGIQKIDEEIEKTFLLGNATHLLREEIQAGLENTQSILQEDSAFNGIFGGSSSIGIPYQNAFGVSNTKFGFGKNKDIKIAGRDRAIVKRVSNGNIVALEFEGNIFGYIYLDIVEVDPDGTVIPSDKTGGSDESSSIYPSPTMAGGNSLQNMVYSAKDDGVDGNNQTNRLGGRFDSVNGDPIDGVTDRRLRFMADAFANRLSKETNMKLIRKSTAFKQAIYNTLCIKKLKRQEKIRIVYLKPNEVVRFDRGQSIFDNILFFAKLYITSLMTILMQNVLRGAPKRIVYVEVGNENSSGSAIQQVIRDMKSKEISAVHNLDIQSLLNHVGETQDLYIPVVDGEKPLSFDSLEAQEAKSLDDDFVKWLGDNIYTGMGVPSSFVSEVENVEFAKTLSMQNGRWLRDIIADQAILGRAYTDLVRLIYFLEYRVGELEEKDEDTKPGVNRDMSSELKTFDISAISIRFPSPSSLNLTNLVDQMSNVKTYIDGFDDILDVSAFANGTPINEDAETSIQKRFKLAMTKRLIPNIDWEAFESTMTEVMTDFIRDEVKNSATKKENEESSESGGF